MCCRITFRCPGVVKNIPTQTESGDIPPQFRPALFVDAGCSLLVVFHLSSFCVDCYFKIVACQK